jgi:Spy/CpxP family protein refolding chaperone
MKYKVTLVILASVLCLSVASLVNAQSSTSPAVTAQDPPQRRQFNREGMKLTDAQRAQLKSLRENQRSQIQALRKDSNLSREDLRAKVQAIRQSSRQQFLSMLTPEQQQALKSRFNGRREGGPGRGDRGPRGGGRGGPGFARLGLSADQQAKLKEIHQGARNQIDAIRNDSSLTRDQRQAKVRSIRESIGQQANTILTSEQQQQLRERRRGGPGRFGPRGPRGGRRGPVGPNGPDSASPIKP